MSEKLSEKFERDFGSKTDYFNHRGGLFEEIKTWIDQHDTSNTYVADQYCSCVIQEKSSSSYCSVCTGLKRY